MDASALEAIKLAMASTNQLFHNEVFGRRNLAALDDIYTRDARLHIDNNGVENAIRPVAVGRKNYLFAGSHDAAQRAAMVYSLLATCKLHNSTREEIIGKTIFDVSPARQYEAIRQRQPKALAQLMDQRRVQHYVLVGQA